MPKKNLRNILLQRGGAFDCKMLINKGLKKFSGGDGAVISKACKCMLFYTAKAIASFFAAGFSADD